MGAAGWNGPWGQAGSAAVSLRQFETYYGPQGGAWPFEKQALVKLRCVAGHAELSDRVHATRDQLVYSGQTFDFPAMHALRERQIRQFVRPGTIHAKLSEGALVDCEYAVQALQLTFGHRLCALRSANTLEALQAANRCGLLLPDQYESVHEACVFLRQLIDCLRMVRGNARDLTIPAARTADYEQLRQRLQRIYGDGAALDDLPLHLSAIRQFASDVQSVCKDDNSD